MVLVVEYGSLTRTYHAESNAYDIVGKRQLKTQTFIHRLAVPTTQVAPLTDVNDGM